MAARVRSDCRIARAGAGMRTCGPERVRQDRATLPTQRKERVRRPAPEVSTRRPHHGRADRQGPEAAATPPGHEHEDQGPRA